MLPIVPITKLYRCRKAGSVASGPQSSTPFLPADARLDLVGEFARYLFGSVPAAIRASQAWVSSQRLTRAAASGAGSMVLLQRLSDSPPTSRP